VRDARGGAMQSSQNLTDHNFSADEISDLLLNLGKAWGACKVLPSAVRRWEHSTNTFTPTRIEKFTKRWKIFDSALQTRKTWAQTPETHVRWSRT
jgi:hypothetical protein